MMGIIKGYGSCYSWHWVIIKPFNQSRKRSLPLFFISLTGLIHGYKIEGGAIVNNYGINETTWPFAVGYAGVALVFLVLGLGKETNGSSLTSGVDE